MKLKIAEGVYVLCIPTEWKIEAPGSEAEDVAMHVAKQVLGEKARFWEAESAVHGEVMRAKALSAVADACAQHKREFEIESAALMLVRIGGETWKERGSRHVWIMTTKETKQ